MVTVGRIPAFDSTPPTSLSLEFRAKFPNHPRVKLQVRCEKLERLALDRNVFRYMNEMLEYGSKGAIYRLMRYLLRRGQ